MDANELFAVGKHLASIAVFETEHGIKAAVKIADEETHSIVDVPPHLAAQIPMAIGMMRNAS